MMLFAKDWNPINEDTKKHPVDPESVPSEETYIHTLSAINGECTRKGL